MWVSELVRDSGSARSLSLFKSLISLRLICSLASSSATDGLSVVCSSAANGSAVVMMPCFFA